MQRIKCLLFKFVLFIKENIPEDEMAEMIRDMDRDNDGEITV